MAHVSERLALYFRDVYDHLVRISESIDAARDLLGDALEAYLSMVASARRDHRSQLTFFGGSSCR